MPGPTTSPEDPIPNAVPASQAGALPVPLAQEAFQRAYIGAIAAAARCIHSVPSPDVDGIDLTLRQEVHGNDFFESALDLQLKSTSQTDALAADHVKITLSQQHYDRLRTPRVTVPRILIVMTIPADLSDWHRQTEEELRLLRCSYWTSLKGRAEIQTATTTVRVPRANVFSVEALCDLMYRVRAGHELGGDP